MDTSSIHDPLLQRVLATAQRTREHCISMLDFLDSHKQTAPTNNEEDLRTLAKYQKALSAHLSILRGEHRSSVYSVRESKSLTAAAKSEIDSLHLQLQNLFYEQQHLRGEIQACEQYPHRYTDLSLSDEADFLASRPDFDGDEHALMLARIKDEHEQRRKLEKERLGLVKKKLELIKANGKEKDKLDKLDKDIEAWLEGRSKIEALFEERAKKERDDGMEGVETTPAA